MENINQDKLNDLFKTIFRLVGEEDPKVTPEQLFLAASTGGFSFINSLLNGAHEDQSARFAINVSKSVPEIVFTIHKYGGNLDNKKKLHFGSQLFKTVAENNLNGVSKLQKDIISNSLASFVKLYTNLCSKFNHSKSVKGSGAINWLNSKGKNLTGGSIWGWVKDTVGDKMRDIGTYASSWLDPQTSFYTPEGTSVWKDLAGLAPAAVGAATGMGPIGMALSTALFHGTKLALKGLHNWWEHEYYLPTLDNPSSHPWINKMVKPWYEPIRQTYQRMKDDPYTNAQLQQLDTYIGQAIPAAMQDIQQQRAAAYAYNQKLATLEQMRKQEKAQQKLTYDKLVLDTEDENNKRITMNEREKTKRNQEIADAETFNENARMQNAKAMEDYNALKKQAADKEDLRLNNDLEKLDNMISATNKGILDSISGAVNFNVIENSKNSDTSNWGVNGNVKTGVDGTSMGVPIKGSFEIGAHYGQQHGKSESGREWQEEESKEFNKAMTSPLYGKNFDIDEYNKIIEEARRAINGRDSIEKDKEMDEKYNKIHNTNYSSTDLHKEEAYDVLFENKDTRLFQKDKDKLTSEKVLNRMEPDIRERAKEYINLYQADPSNFFKTLEHNQNIKESLEQQNSSGQTNPYPYLTEDVSSWNKQFPHTPLTDVEYTKLKQALNQFNFKPGFAKMGNDFIQNAMNRETLAEIINNNYVKTNPDYFKTKEFKEFNRRLSNSISKSFNPQRLEDYVAEPTIIKEKTVPGELTEKEMIQLKEKPKEFEYIPSANLIDPEPDKSMYATPNLNLATQQLNMAMANRIPFENTKQPDNKSVLPPIDLTSVEQVQPGPTTDYKNAKSSLRFRNIPIYREQSRIHTNPINMKHLQKNIAVKTKNINDLFNSKSIPTAFQQLKTMTKPDYKKPIKKTVKGKQRLNRKLYS